ncbi:Transcription termination factor, mitochondrial/chloroplastic [Dillenia turbinata]|uniref:Transcription termination factor, mitochondrial/chloroplastic n=1 Tax=Dillenia turbinata TaxID=194707 RepID=A0AAN8ZLQ8_9MAGN
MLHSLHVPTTFSLSSPQNLNPLSLASPSSPSPYPPLILQFRTAPRENLRYLKTLGIIHPKTRLYKFPSPITLEQIVSTVDFLKSKGFSDSDFPRLAFLVPKLFSPHFDPNNVVPVFEFLTFELSASLDESKRLILRCPEILFSNVEYCLRPTLNYLREIGIQKLNRPSNLNAYLLNTRVDKLDERMRFLRCIGLPCEDSARICARFPAIFRYSLESNLIPKYEYLVGEMKRDVVELNGFPQYFGYSLEKRIVPRHLHLKQRNVKVPLQRLLLLGDEKFYAKWK